MVKFEVQGLAEITALMQRLDLALDTRDLLDEGAAILLSRTRQRFLSEVAPDGTPWIPSLAARLRASTGRGGGTLFDTGNLFHSLQVYAVGEDSREVGTDVEYGIYHQSPRAGIRRQFLGVSEDDADTVVKFITSRINRAMT